ncbi:MAG: flagellar basal body rod protein FlgC [Actinomycetes bacterium]
MSLFEALGISGTGLTVNNTWMSAISDNIANMNNAVNPSQPAFQTRYVVARAMSYGSANGGVEVAGTALGSSAGTLVHDPTSPLADKNGYVRMPDVNLGDQMTQLIMAERAYQANLSVISRAMSAYQSAMTLGKNA